MEVGRTLVLSPSTNDMHDEHCPPWAKVDTKGVFAYKSILLTTARVNAHLQGLSGNTSSRVAVDASKKPHNPSLMHSYARKTINMSLGVY
jgi:hypothetical protein